MANFDIAVAYVLDNEKGYVDRPDDRGGPTKFGITMKTLADYRKTPVTIGDIQDLTMTEAKDVYKAKYWLNLGFDLITNAFIATALMDVAVLYGPQTSVKIAQKAVNSLGCNVTVDGFLGQNSAAAINTVQPSAFIKSFHGLIIDRIDAIVRNDPSESSNEQGWENRADRLLSLA